MFHFKYINPFSLIFFIFLLVITGCSDHDSNENRFSEPLKLMLNDVIETYQAPGASMAIKYKDGSVFTYAAGLSDKEENKPLTPGHPFRIGSASKTVTASAVLLLYQRGRLSLDAAIESILPGQLPGYGDRITVRMLLNHTSSLEDYVS